MMYFFFLNVLMLVTADDTAFHDCDKDLNSLINTQEHDSLLAIEWFENNIKLNQDTTNTTMYLLLLVSQ